MEGSVDRIALGVATYDSVRAIDIGEATATIERVVTLATVFGFLDDARHIVRHPGVRGEVAFDKLLGLLAGMERRSLRPKAEMP